MADELEMQLTEAQRAVADAGADVKRAEAAHIEARKNLMEAQARDAHTLSGVSTRSVVVLAESAMKEASKALRAARLAMLEAKGGA